MALADNLIAYYSLDDATDAESSFNLTNTGSTPFNAGKIDDGADFTPNDSLNNNSVLASTSYPKSFSAWFKADTITGDDRTVFSLSDGSIHYYILKIRDSDDHLVFRSNNNTQAADVDTGIVVSTGTYYHVVVIQNSSTSVDIWVDNVLTNDDATTFVATVDEFYLGYLGRSSVWWFDGIIDEVGVWDRGLTADDVNNSYFNGDGQAYPLTLIAPSDFIPKVMIF